MELHPQYENAVEALQDSNLEKLRSLLNQFPELVHERHTSDEGIYAGYFYRPTLLHHVGFNPYPNKPFPTNIVEITRLLLEYGADPNVVCGGGPKQPQSDHGTVIGLIMSGFSAINNGHARALVELLLENGAQMHHGTSGVNLFGALYHTVENQKQREAARILYDLGHEIDMVFAAGLGLLDVLKSYENGDGTLKEGADCFFKQHRRDEKEASVQDIYQDCLLAASITNELQVLDYLLNRGIDLNQFRRWGPWEVTPLHGACWAGWLEATQYLIERGAETTIYDPEHGSTPIGWAHYCGRKEVFDWFNEREELFGMVDALEFGKFERFKSLLGDQDPDTAVGEGQPGVLLRVAAYNGLKEAVTYLLEKGANPQIKSSQGKTALDWAKEQGHEEVVNLLNKEFY